MIYQDIENSTKLLCYLSPTRNQGYADNSFNTCEVVDEDEHKFGYFLSYGRLHSFNSCVFLLVFNIKVHSASTNAKICNCDPIKLSVSNYH